MRDQNKNIANNMDIGSGATGPTLTGAAALSFSAWVVIDAVTTTFNDANRLFGFEVGSGQEGFSAGIDALTSTPDWKVRVFGKAAVGETSRSLNSSTTVVADTRIHVAGALDFANDMIYVWVDGVETSGAGAFTSTSYTFGTATETDRVACDTGALTSTRQLNGAIGELAIWKRLLTANEAAALALGMSPWLIDAPALYWGLYGYDSPEIDMAAGLNVTLIGSHVKRTEEVPVLPIESLVAQAGFPFVSSFNVAPLASNLMRRKAA